MKTYTCYEEPIKVFGVPFFEEKKKLERVPEELRAKLGNLVHYGRRCPGARVCFRTDAEEFTVRVHLETLNPDVGMSIYACQACSVMVGDRQNSVFAALLNPPDYNTKVFEKTVKKSSNMEDVTIWVLRNEVVENIEIIVPDDACVEAPTPYKYGKALYYGSSITEGGCCCNITNGYNAIISRWLDLDYYNFGFSGSARGELEMADYINTIDMSIFILDYDYNSPDVEDLRNTHEPFFKRIREANPNLPILMLTKPDFDYSEDGAERRAVIKETYDNAVKAGDKNVYFIDGETFFGKEDRELCTIDRIHPNDLGFYRMAGVILPTIKTMLGIED
ncbi:MAG: hypothetical protein E7588_04015 [Ruminococcaceae bacterium]|nr:hypothetical protein [Oscillospiraceae bacterium]